MLSKVACSYLSRALRAIGFLKVFLCFCAITFSTFAEEAKSLNTNANLSIIYESGSAHFVVAQEEDSSVEFEIVGFEKIEGVIPNIKFSVSENQRFILVTFNASEYDLIAQVYDVIQTSKVYEGSIDDAAWLPRSTALVMVPKSNEDYWPITRGVMIYEPEKNERSQLFIDRFFFGRIEKVDNSLIVSATLDNAIQSEQANVRISLKNGNISLNPVCLD